MMARLALTSQQDSICQPGKDAMAAFSFESAHNSLRIFWFPRWADHYLRNNFLFASPKKNCSWLSICWIRRNRKSTLLYLNKIRKMNNYCSKSAKLEVDSDFHFIPTTSSFFSLLRMSAWSEESLFFAVI